MERLFFCLSRKQKHVDENRAVCILVDNMADANPIIVVALKEIRKYQTSFDLLIPKIPFRRLVKEIATDITLHQVYWFQKLAIDAL